MRSKPLITRLHLTHGGLSCVVLFLDHWQQPVIMALHHDCIMQAYTTQHSSLFLFPVWLSISIGFFSSYLMPPDDPRLLLHSQQNVTISCKTPSLFLKKNNTCCGGSLRPNALMLHLRWPCTHTPSCSPCHATTICRTWGSGTAYIWKIS